MLGWVRAVTGPVLPKAVHVCSDHFTKDSFDESQELKQHLLGGNFKHILKPDAVPSSFPNGKAVNKSVSYNIEETIKFRNVKVSLFNIHIYRENAKTRIFHTAVLRINL